jgi:hypothetical protein
MIRGDNFSEKVGNRKSRDSEVFRECEEIKGFYEMRKICLHCHIIVPI